MGTALAGPGHVFDPPKHPFGNDASDVIDLVFLPFQPGPGYLSVQPVCSLAWQAFNNLGFLGPASEPESDIAGRNAQAAAQALWDELELWSSRGDRIPGHVRLLYDLGAESELPYWLDISIDRSADGVVALLPSPRASAPAFESPPT